MSEYNVRHKQIEDIIDARKETGQYDVYFNSTRPIGQIVNTNTRYVYSTPTFPIDDIRDDLGMWNIEGDNNNDPRAANINNLGPTDSEITLVRVKREGSQFKTQENNWDMHDKAIPGDGTHLGESPSMVNLVTLIVPSKQPLLKSNRSSNEQEYMVPLSSWDPVRQDPPQMATTVSESIQASTSSKNSVVGPIEIIKPPQTEKEKAPKKSFAKKVFRLVKFKKWNKTIKDSEQGTN